MEQDSLAPSRMAADIVPKFYWIQMGVFNDMVTHLLAWCQNHGALEFQLLS